MAFLDKITLLFACSSTMPALAASELQIFENAASTAIETLETEDAFLDFVNADDASDQLAKRINRGDSEALLQHLVTVAEYGGLEHSTTGIMVSAYYKEALPDQDKIQVLDAILALDANVGLAMAKAELSRIPEPTFIQPKLARMMTRYRGLPDVVDFMRRQLTHPNPRVGVLFLNALAHDHRFGAADIRTFVACPRQSGENVYNALPLDIVEFVFGPTFREGEREQVKSDLATILMAPDADGFSQELVILMLRELVDEPRYAQHAAYATQLLHSFVRAYPKHEHALLARSVFGTIASTDSCNLSWKKGGHNTN